MSHSLTQSEVLDIATSIAFYILTNGGEINRVEDTAERIGKAYGMDSVHAFAISSTIVLSVEKDGVSLSQTRRVKEVKTNLHKVEKYNALSRKICETLPSYEEIVNELNEIKNIAPYSTPISLFAFALIGGAFSVFFGGGLYEFIAGFLIGIILKLVTLTANYLQSPPFFVNVAGAAATVTLTHIATLLYAGLNTEIVNIGVLMNLVPGVLLTNCIRDFVATDYVAGMAKITEAVLIALAIALGVAVSVFWR